MIVGIGIVLCLAVILWVVVSEWPATSKTRPQKRIDFYA